MGDTFFFIEEGEAVVRKKQNDEEKDINHLKKGDYFGGMQFHSSTYIRSMRSLELSLLRREPRAATVSAVIRKDPNSPKLKVAALDAAAFTRLLGPLREIMERKAGERYGGPYGIAHRLSR